MIGIICVCLLAVVICWAQAGKTIFLGEQDGLSHRHISQILQDKDGFIWISTWNGLDRFDGREFVTFKSRPGDGVDMPSDRFRNIAIDDHNPNVINCRVDDNWFHFSLLNGAFTPATPAENRIYMTHPGYGNGKFENNSDTTRFTLLDHQGIVWNVLNNGISMTIPGSSPISVESMNNPAEVKCVSADSLGRIWVASKEDKTVRIIDHGTTYYLAPDGTLHSTPVSFGVAVYCIYQSPQSKWNVWLGTKPD